MCGRPRQSLTPRRNDMRRKRIALGMVGLLVAGVAAWSAYGIAQETAPDKKGPDRAAVERARETAKLIDALYKNYVVAITETYVGEKKQPPAARVTQRVFRAMHKGGFHDAKLV